MPAALWSQPFPAENEWVVVIDAGHGGKDPGAVGAFSKEKNINLAVALKTGRYISENLKDVKVVYTRDDDSFPGLAERAEVANKHKADLFISIHSNAMTDKRFSGAETYVLGQTMDEANLQVAMKENSVITIEKDYETKYEGFDPNSVESYIIFSLMQNTYLKQSTEFATMVQNQFRDRVGRKDRGVRQAGFVVLWRTTMPSVLIELGFISNAEEEKYLNSAQGQDYLASAIFRAFRDYRQTIDNRSGVKPGNSARLAQVSENSGDAKDDSLGKPVTDTAGRQDTGDSVKPVADSAVKPVVTAKVTDSTSLPAQSPAQNTSQQPAQSPAQSASGTRAAVQVSAPSAREATADDIYFMVQVSAMPRNREMDQLLLRGIETVTRIEDGERVKYAAGKFPVYVDAVKYRRTLILRFPDAFVIAVRNGKTMPLREAVEAKKQK
ncbi:MAG: N-acetylmuramoyl-L-alanine amidase [Bacteroidales bacterium]